MIENNTIENNTLVECKDCKHTGENISPGYSGYCLYPQMALPRAYRLGTLRCPDGKILCSCFELKSVSSVPL